MKISWIKRISGILLVVFMLSDTMPVNCVYAQTGDKEALAKESVALETQAYVGNFNLNEYRADIYLRNDTVCNRIIQFMKEATFPSHVITNQLNGDAVFQNSVSAWKTVHFVTSPSEIVKGGMDEKGYYTAIILSVFKAETNNDTYIWDNVKKVESNANKILSNVKKWVKESDQIDLTSISKNQILTTIPISDQNLIREHLAGEFKENHPVLNNSSTVASDLAAVFDAVDTLGEAIELMESYIRVMEISDSMKTVLNGMYNQCSTDNPAMKSALYEASLASENLSGALNATISNTAGKGTSKVLGVLLDEGWSALIKSNPYAQAFMTGASVGTWLGDTVCNTLFSTNKTIEQYEKMKCLDEFTTLQKSVLADMGNTYLSNKSTKNAENYFVAMDALFSTADLSCSFASDYAKILYEDTSLGWVTIGETNYEQYMNSVNSIKGYYRDHKKSLVDNYLAELEYDYPDIYAILMGLDGEDPIAVTDIDFDYEETVIGMEDLFFPSVKKPVISPSNATNQKITYASSDTAILDISAETGWYRPKKAGVVTVMATSEDGGFTDTIRVRVVEGQSGAWDAVTMPGIVDRGKCGENLYWVLYENGKLVISGEGEMEDYDYDHSNHYIPAPWFSYENKIKEVVIEGGAISIGKYAFKGCNVLDNITIPESIVKIRRCAFEGCTDLEKITIPESVTSMSYGVFRDCPNLKTAGPLGGNYDIEFGWTSKIPSDAFAGCTSLMNIKFPENVTRIGNSSFSGCVRLGEIEIPESVTEIGEYAFCGCTNLGKIIIPEGVMDIDERAFLNCSNLKTAGPLGGNYNIEFGWREIPPCAFSGCKSLEEIMIPDGVTAIGYYAFKGCTSLGKITIPESVTGIGQSAFKGCTNLEEIIIPDRLTIYDRAFEGCIHLRHIIISENVIIGINVFSECPNLKTAGPIGGGYDIEFGWTGRFPEYAFWGCTSLEKIIIPESVTGMGNYVFSGCLNLKTAGPIGGDYDIEFGWTREIPDCAFRGCESLEKIIIPESVTEMGEYAFSRCPNLKTAGPIGGDYDIEFGWTREIPDCAFRGCESLEKIITPESLTEIGFEAFSGCTSLGEIIIPQSVTMISYDAFRGCTSLEDITIPESVAMIGPGAFMGCTSLEEIKIPKGVTEIGSDVFSGCLSLRNIAIPDSVRSIHYDSFYNCDNLTICGKENSYAHTYALEHNIPFVSLSSAVQVTNIILNPTKATLKPGETLHIELSVIPENAENKQLKWVTDNSQVATVEEGLVSAIGEGTVTVTAVSRDGSDITASCRITVLDNAGSSQKRKQVITGTNNYSKLTGCKPFRLDARLSIGQGRLGYVSSNPSVASVSGNGTVTVKKVGDTVITITAAPTSNYLACEFKVKLKVIAPAKGTMLTDVKTKAKYKVVKQGKTLEYNKPKDKNVTKVLIPATITISGVKYSVTGISANAFSGCKKLKNVTVGKNISSIGTKAFHRCSNLTKFTIPSKVSKIGKQAFGSCGKLKFITVQTTKLTTKAVGSDAFNGINSNAILKVPKKKKAAYVKLFREKGIGKNVKVK